MFLILITFVTILFISFICSLCEAVLLSLSQAYVEVVTEKKSKAGEILKNVIDNKDRSISAILTLNTISHTLGSAGLAYLVHLEYGDKYVTLASVILTLAILIFSEILPKNLGQNNPKAFSFFAAFCVQLMVILLYPVVKLSEQISKVLRNQNEEPDVTRDEMIKTAEIGVEEGTLKSKESVIIKNLMKLDNIYVSDIMTPRSVITALDGEMTVQEVAKKYRPIRFSRIPVFQDSLDQIIGITHRYKILEALSQDQHNLKIAELVSPILHVSERMTVSQVLDLFIKEKSHLAIVSDEYGVVTGIVTLEDAIETLLGVEIVDEFDNIEDMRKYALEQWQQRKKHVRT